MKPAGTLLATTEATGIPDSYKERILASDGEDTTFTTAYDTLFDLRFPTGVGARVAANRFTSEWHGRDDALRQRRDDVLPLMSPSHRQRHDPDIDPTWMGQSAGMVHHVRSVADVVGGMCDDAEDLLGQRVAAMLRPGNEHPGVAARPLRER